MRTDLPSVPTAPMGDSMRGQRPPRDAGSDRAPAAPELGLGARIAAARQAAGLDREGLARRTKISLRNLRAIEEERFAELPAPAYVRGYLRMIAAEVGQDPRPWLHAMGSKRPAVDEALPPGRRTGLMARPLFGDAIHVPVRIGHLLTVLFAILTFFLLYFALEGRSDSGDVTATRQDSSLLDVLDTRPIEPR